MWSNLLQTGLLVTAALAAGSIALAQQPSPPPEPQQKQQQEQWQHTPSGKAGKEEPSSHAPTPPPTSNEVLVNGALNVPGAPTNTDTIPAKFSVENAADDKLITAAYTFKTLTEEQRRAIYQSLKGQSPATAFNADVGTELPLAIELRPVPDEVASRVPQTKGYQYALAANQVLLVSPPNRVVVGVFSDAK
jgi:Protein of unknown function (DUF1236)